MQVLALYDYNNETKSHTTLLANLNVKKLVIIHCGLPHLLVYFTKGLFKKTIGKFI